MENCITSDFLSASVCRNAGSTESLKARGVYRITCIDSAGRPKWVAVAPNLVVDEGKNAMLDDYFDGSTAGTFYMSLITAGSPVATATYAAPLVTEISDAVIGARGTVSWLAASGGVKTAVTTSFAITGTATITGNMVVSGSTAAAIVGDTAAGDGVLFSCAVFALGSKAVLAGDILNVVYSIGL